MDEVVGQKRDGIQSVVKLLNFIKNMKRSDDAGEITNTMQNMCTKVVETFFPNIDRAGKATYYGMLRNSAHGIVTKFF